MHDIYVPKFKTIGSEGIIAAAPKFGLGSEFNVIRYNRGGLKNYESGWFDNLIVDGGMNLLGGSGGDYCCREAVIGDSATAADYTDTALGNQTAVEDTDAPVPGFGNGGASNYEYWMYIGSRFNPGTGTGPVREVGIKSGITGTGPLFSRAVLPAAISKASDETLDVIWKYTKYPPLSDSDSTATFDGIVYDTKTRMLSAGAVTSFWGTHHWKYNGIDADASEWRAYDGAIGAITDTAPSGTDADVDFDTIEDAAYNPDSWELAHTVDIGLDGWNLAGGIRTFEWKTNLWQFQTQLTAQGTGDTLPKDETEVLENMLFKTTWGRHSGS